MMSRVRKFGALGVLAGLWGLFFSAVSSKDYASHLDRGLHDLHCSFIPGMSAVSEGAGCRVALNSPYAAMFKEQLWGGVPISLFGVGCFAFLVGFAAFIWLRGARTSLAIAALYGLLASSPLVVSIGMFAISWFKLGAICKTCAGIYIGSLALAISGVGVFFALRESNASSARTSAVPWLGTLAALLGLLLATLTPAVVYAALAPDHQQFVAKCGTIKVPTESHQALLKMTGSAAQKQALFFEDPLCPTCKSLHQRLELAGVLERLDVDLALFPLDNECNWMLDQPLHPGACTLSRALLCAASPREMLEWAYDNQTTLAEAGKAGEKVLTAAITARWGAGIARCMTERTTTTRLNRHLHFAVDNGIAVSTPQVFLAGQRLCDEDIDIGLMFALRHLAPELLP
jgi:protein-disulfide isomerase